jgi:hypothetical protein
MVWFDETLRLRPCTTTSFAYFEGWIAPATQSPFNPAKIEKTETGIDGWLEKEKKR